MKKHTIFSLSLALLFAIAPLFSTIAQDLDKKQQPSQEQINKYIDEWLKSPIKYIITKEESKAFKKLKDRQEKIRFINYFWLRRDPNPKTPVNEFRDEFYKRVATTNYHFKAGGKAGWKTQRGQIFIIFGPTQMINRGVTAALRSYEVWTYDRLPSRKIPAQYSIVFIDWYGNRDYRIAFGDYIGKSAFERYMDSLHSIPGSGFIPHEVASAMEDMKQMAIVNKDIEFKDVPISTKIHANLPFKFYRTHFQTGKDEVQSLLGIRFRYSDITFREAEGKKFSPAINIEASLLDKGNNAVASFKQTLAFPIESQQLEEKKDESFVFWRSLRAKPGEYILSIKAEDEISGANSAWEKEIAIPLLQSKELSLSEVILADLIAPSPQIKPDEASIDIIWLMGNQIIPNLDGVFNLGADFCFFFQLLNLQLDKQSFKPLVEINCTILKNDKIIKTIELPDTSFTSRKPDEIIVSSCIPLIDFSPGEYTLNILATDKTANKDISRQLEFRVIENKP